MFLRIFTIAENAKQSENIGDKLLFPLEKYIFKKKCISNEQYWKFKEMFVLEIELTLKNKVSVSALNDFFSTISDKWDKYDFADEIEILMSDKMEGCDFKNHDIAMVNMFLKKSECFDF